MANLDSWAPAIAVFMIITGVGVLIWDLNRRVDALQKNQAELLEIINSNMAVDADQTRAIKNLTAALKSVSG